MIMNIIWALLDRKDRILSYKAFSAINSIILTQEDNSPLEQDLVMKFVTENGLDEKIKKEIMRSSG